VRVLSVLRLVRLKQPGLTFILNELTVVVVVPERLEHRFIGKCVMVANEGFKVLGGFLAVI